MLKEKLSIIAMAAVAVSRNWSNEITDKTNIDADSPIVCEACVEFVGGYNVPFKNGKIETDTVHNDVDEWAKSYVEKLLNA